MQRKCYIIVVTQALVVCLICPPSALGPAALGLRVYISGRPLVPVLQLLHKLSRLALTEHLSILVVQSTLCKYRTANYCINIRFIVESNIW